MTDDQKTGIQSISDWWANNPMTYGKIHGSTDYLSADGVQSVELGSEEFFTNADRVFLKWNASLHTADAAFGKIFDFDQHAGKNVLEIGCGMGFMAMNWGMQRAKITAVDLNPVAVQQTRQRFKLFNIPGDVLRINGEDLPFEDGSFSFAYSWGVLHHTPGIVAAIEEIHRVLKPGGSIGLMLYNRGSLRQKYLINYLEGYLHLENEFLNPLQLNSRYGDGAQKEGNPHTWPVTAAEVKQILMPQFSDVKIRVLGTEIGNVLDLLLPGLGKYAMPTIFKKSLARRWGWSLWITGNKPV